MLQVYCWYSRLRSIDYTICFGGNSGHLQYINTVVPVTYVILHYFILMSLSLTYPCSAEESVAGHRRIGTD